MGNCLVAQSGGPTAVINASLAGVVRANQLNPLYDRVFGGLHGIEGVLDGKLYDLTDLSGHELEILKQTPSSALGTCRYKLKRGADADYCRLIEVMDANDIEVMFYIGGNDSMDTIAKLSRYGAQVVLTGLDYEPGKVGSGCLSADGGTISLHERIAQYYPGTGDLFAAVVLGALLNGRALADACALAGEFVKDCIAYTAAQHTDPMHGVQFEKLLPRLFSCHENRTEV